jgi:hypothetical protein
VKKAHPSRSIPLLFLAGALAVSTASSGAAPPAARWIERGAAALAPFKQRLLATLRAALERGPEAAIDACRVEAPRLAAEASGSGVRVGRTSHRLRNPRNAPEPWMQPLLDAYLAGASLEPQAVGIGPGRVGYVEPILVQPLCLVCHGETLAPEVAARLDALYPEDRARGFRAGDFRGLFWAELLETGD